MKNQETIEKNRLIAEFMGDLTVNADGDIKEDLNSFKYHTSWDWLMPVVEKIESLGYAVEITESYCAIKDLSNIADIGGGDYTKLSATYQAVTEFIKWYNTNK